jgi:eisosome component PIL1
MGLGDAKRCHGLEPTSSSLVDQDKSIVWPGRSRYGNFLIPSGYENLQRFRRTSADTCAWEPRSLTHYLGHAIRGRTAGAFGPDLAKKLAQLVKMEKNVMRSLELVAKERMEVAVGIRQVRRTLRWDCSQMYNK